ncbi:MAG TPA: EAL domain-containing protein, partial [Pseudomonadales bacterium]|nr:EAL domain-containing protein [Pseudomonadales bacterium]
DVKGCTPELLKSGSHPEEFYQTIISKLRAGEIFEGIVISRHKQGQLFYQDTRITPLKDSGGCITHFVVNGRDVSQEMRTKKSRDQLISVVEATTDIVFMCGLDEKISYANRAARNAFGLPKSGALPVLYLSDVHAAHCAEKLKLCLQSAREQGVWQGEMDLRQSGAQSITASEVILAHTDREGGFAFYSLIARDISERIQFETELSYKSTHDSLTGLANRALLADRVEVAMNQALRSQTMVALILLDLDNFKRINEGMGHAVGDSVLQQIAMRLKQLVRPSDTVARVGGDEFVMVLGGLSSTQVVAHLLRKIQIEFDSAINVCGQDFYLSFSVGVCFSPNDGRSFEELLRNADAAMHGAKRQGGGQSQWYRSEINKRGQELLSLESDLRKALMNREFRLAYQPQIDVASGKMQGIEALLRWQHPSRGMMEPSEFVYLLEETGLIVQVGEWVLFQACFDFVVSLGNPYFNARRVSVNVSPRQFTDPAFVDIINQVIDETGIHPDMLELEITESTVMRDVQRANDILCALSGLGVRLAVDDFGTGYSSLAYLKRFPLNVLKIDRTFIRDVPEDQNDNAITEASVSLGHKLGLSVVAEGVENQAQLEYLRRCGCDLVQGFYTGKPAPIEQIIRNAILTTA